MSTAPIAVTFFDDALARRKRERQMTIEELGELIVSTTAPTKVALPWFKLARFGDLPTEKDSLRWDGNVRCITGVEADYDGGRVTFDEAVEVADKAGLLAIVYTSPSHTAVAPRWRIICPTSTELPPASRAQLIARLNGLYRGIFAAESWTLSQSYYYGSVNDSPAHQVSLIEGQPIDRLDELDEIAIGKSQTKPTGSAGNGAAPTSGAVDEAALLEQIRSGASYHNAAIRLLGAWALHGVPLLKADQRLHTAFDAVLLPDRDQRWHDRVAEIPKLLHYVYGKDADARDAQAAGFADFTARQPPPGADDYDTDTSWASPAPPEEPWPEMAAEAFHGLAGQVVEAIAPTTEADPVAILAHFLVEAGNAIGRKPYCVADGARHYPNLYALLIGDTSKGRKGTAARRVEQVISAADSDWHLHCIASGLSSGEGIIHAVHDEIRSREKTGGKGKQIQYVEVVKDPGIVDKRLLIIEPEFAGALEVMKREGSTLSRVIREAYDSGNLRVLTKNSPEKATGAHVSIIGHITVDEYRVSLDRTSMVNGYANRFLNLLVKRAQELPFGGFLDEATVAVLADRTRQALGNTALWREITFSPEAGELWIAGYHDLSAGKPGLFGSVVARGEAHTLRLALLYAVLDQQRQIATAHLRAALAFWQYCETSARYIFGDYLGDPLADEILRILRQVVGGGMTRTELYDVLGRHRPSKRTGEALGLLLRHGKVRRTQRPTSGRPVEIWTAI